GLFVFHPPIAAPAINVDLATAGDGSAARGVFNFMFSGTKTLSGESDLPAVFPLLFMVIACGAVSGFHSLVSSGTTAKQISNETEARIVGYGGMVFEGVLAIVVIIACTAGVAYVATAGGSTPEQRWHQRYSSFSAMNKLGPKLDAVITGGGLMMSKAGLPFSFSIAFVAAVAVAFAMTTLDTGTRLLRYNIEEFGSLLKIRLLANRYFASAVAVAALAFFAFRQGQAFALWKLFGASNQLLAVLGLLVATVYLYRRGKSVVYTLVPMLFLATATAAAMVSTIQKSWPKDGEGDLGLVAVASIVLFIAAWLGVEGILAMRTRGRESIDAEPADTAAP
ncbi:MAG: carbon starvation protein A, partial [Planctomycetes bacterium]|nr:carbon starvation protein A [Planctomycetota bacterium]